MSAVIIRTPIGMVGIEERDGQIVHLYFPNKPMPVSSAVIAPVLQKAVRELQEYFLPAKKDLLPNAGMSPTKKVDSDTGNRMSDVSISTVSREKDRKSKTTVRRSFNIPLLLLGTDFQKAVWSEMLKIPYGETISYKELARRTGREKAVRATASACAKNALGIFIPCHRVIGSNGCLTGFGGGLDVKNFLLDMERSAVR